MEIVLIKTKRFTESRSHEYKKKGMAKRGVFLALLLLLSVNGQVVEEWYQNLQHYGPLKTEGWNPRPMRLIADYTYRIEELACNANDEFMFVSKLATASPPPLGKFSGCLLF